MSLPLDLITLLAPALSGSFTPDSSTCQQNKANTHPSAPPLNPIASSSSLPFCQLSCDLITDLPVSSGFNSLLVMVDHGLSKGVILCPTKKNVTTEGIASLFFHKVFLHFGLYTKIISDQGPQFASKFAKELGCILQYDLSLSTAYHPQTDGETERVNQEIEMYLWIFCSNQPSTWANLITHAEFTHNHWPHSVTRKSPFFLMMGYEPIALSTILPSSSVPAVETHLKELTATKNKALAAHELARQVMANRTRKLFIPFKKGDRVWLEAHNLKWHVTNPKFAPKREGPFTIVKVLLSITSELKLPTMWKIHLVFHASLLSHYGENPIHSPNFPKPPPDLIAGEEEYEIEKILCHRGSPSNCFFLIRWKEFSAEDDSWEPKQNLKHSKTTLTEYKKRHPTVFHPLPSLLSSPLPSWLLTTILLLLLFQMILFLYLLPWNLLLSSNLSHVLRHLTLLSRLLLPLMTTSLLPQLYQPPQTTFIHGLYL